MSLIIEQDLDGQVLKFLNDNKYLQAKKLQLADVTEKVEAKRFWPSEGAYLHKSTLKTLARCCKYYFNAARTVGQIIIYQILVPYDRNLTVLNCMGTTADIENSLFLK